MGGVIFVAIIFIFMFGITLFFAIHTGSAVPIVVAIFLGILGLLSVLQEIKMYKKDHGKKIKHDVNIGFIIIVFCVLSIFGFMLALLIRNISYRNNGIEATAIVYDVNERIEYNTEYDEDGNSYQTKTKTCDVYVEYEVSGVKYQNKLDMSTCKYTEGEKVKIYYDKDNPNKFIGASSWNLLILILCTLFSGGAFVILINKAIKAKRKK